MKPSRLCTSCIALKLLLLIAASAPAHASDERQVNGTLFKIDGVTVLRVWGTPQERGFAHGYLLGDRIVALLDAYLREGPLASERDLYEQQLLPFLARMRIESRIEAELRGILAGVEARRDGATAIEFLGRELRYEDLLAVNCTSDILGIGCSSFAAWGPLTADGHTLAGRNLDWPAVPALLDTQIVHVSIPEPGAGELPWVAITWPSYIGCLTGMNSAGVTVAAHDSAGRMPSRESGFTPFGLIYRKALSKLRAADLETRLGPLMRSMHCIRGSNMMVTRPSAGGKPAAFVVEFDGDSEIDGGATIRQPKTSAKFIVCTNHFRARTGPLSPRCYRSTVLLGELHKRAQSDGQPHITIDHAWQMLDSVTLESLVAYHSVVFEPNKRTMHVALTDGGQPAPKSRKVTLDVKRLIAGEYPGAQR